MCHLLASTDVLTGAVAVIFVLLASIIVTHILAATRGTRARDNIVGACHLACVRARVQDCGHGSGHEGDGEKESHFGQRENCAVL